MTVPQYLAKHDMKPAQLARLVGCSRADASRWAKGTVPREKNLRRLVEVTRGEITSDAVLGIGAPKSIKKRRAA